MLLFSHDEEIFKAIFKGVYQVLTFKGSQGFEKE